MKPVATITGRLFAAAVALALLAAAPPAVAQPAARPPLPAPLGVPQPEPATDQPYAPQPILPGGVVVPLFPAGSKYLKADRVREAERYNLSRSAPGRINSIVGIHNPSIEVHTVEGNLNTGAVVILAAGGGHNTLNVGGEAADFVPFFYNYGVNAVILRNRLRSDGYDPKTDAVADARQAIRTVRAYAKEWRIDPNKIGIMGFSAGAELASGTAIGYDEFDKANADPGDPLAGVSSRPDFVGIVYPGPSPFARGASPPIPKDVPPAFITCPGSGDRGHAIWATEYFTAMLTAGVPNVEMHIYGNGYHPGTNGATAGLTDRNGTPFGTWQHRFHRLVSATSGSCRSRASRRRPPGTWPRSSSNPRAAPAGVRGRTRPRRSNPTPGGRSHATRHPGLRAVGGRLRGGPGLGRRPRPRQAGRRDGRRRRPPTDRPARQGVGLRHGSEDR